MTTKIVDSGMSELSNSTLVTVMADESSCSSNSSTSKMVQFLLDPARPDKVLTTKHRYRKPKNPAELYVNSEEQYQRCLETRAHAKTLRQQLQLMFAADDDDDRYDKDWMVLLNGVMAPTGNYGCGGGCEDTKIEPQQQTVQGLLPLHYALEEQVRGLEKEIFLQFKQQCTQHRRRHAQKIVLSQAAFYQDGDNLAYLSKKSSFKANVLARMLALMDEHYVQELNRLEPFSLPSSAPHEEKLTERAEIITTTATGVDGHPRNENNTKPSNQLTEEAEEATAPRRKVPMATRSFGRFSRKAPKDRKAPSATRSFTKSLRRIGSNFRKSGSIETQQQQQQPVPIVQG